MKVAPIIVSALFGDVDHAWLDGLRRAHFPPERNQIAAHLTMFHHLSPDVEAELNGRLAGYAAGSAPQAMLAGVMDLGAGTALRVASEELEAIRADLADAFRTLLTPQDRAGWRPHVTIQNKVTTAESRKLQADLKATFQPRPLRIKGLASWRYMGGPWEPIRRFSFRG
jgi:hypothetical protein